jgi:hypothetical protein
MTPKEKAKELYFKMYDVYGYDDYHLRAKRCALIAVEEILDLNLGLSNCDEENWAIDKFYLEVKQEIENL